MGGSFKNVFKVTIPEPVFWYEEEIAQDMAIYEVEDALDDLFELPGTLGTMHLLALPSVR